MPAACTAQLHREIRLAPDQRGRVVFADSELGLGGFHWQVTGVEVVHGRASIERVFLLVTTEKTQCVVQLRAAPARDSIPFETIAVRLTAEVEGEIEGGE